MIQIMSSSPMATVLENCQVQPSPSKITELTLPMTYFDILWLPFHPIQRLLFYQFPCSKSHFLDTLVPALKQSLSLTLKHYIPLASNILYPLSSGKPVFRYVEGDSVSLTFAESASDLDHLTSNFARDADQFYEFVPQLAEAEEEAEHKKIPVLALQVTLFPDRGISIGVSNHHSVGDANSIVSFIRAWASVNKFNGDSHLIEANSLPCYDRSVIKDPKGIDEIFWNTMKNIPLQSHSLPVPTNKVRATFVLHQSDIQRLKALVLAQKPGLVHLSSFVVTTAYVWRCWSKSEEVGEKLDDDEPEYFICTADCRARVDPPVPANYLGNFLGGGLAKIKHGDLTGNEGFVLAAEEIGEAIRTKVNNKDEILKGAENWLTDAAPLVGKPTLAVMGSPKFDLYNVDYGWGRPKKMEAVSIDGDRSMSLCKSRESDGSLEIGLSLPKTKMDAFATIFAEDL